LRFLVKGQGLKGVTTAFSIKQQSASHHKAISTTASSATNIEGMTSLRMGTASHVQTSGCTGAGHTTYTRLSRLVIQALQLVGQFHELSKHSLPSLDIYDCANSANRGYPSGKRPCATYYTKAKQGNVPGRCANPYRLVKNDQDCGR